MDTPSHHYVEESLTSNNTGCVFFVSLLVAFGISIFNIGFAVLFLVTSLILQLVAVVIVSRTPDFRKTVDRKYRAKQRTQLEEALTAKIDKIKPTRGGKFPFTIPYSEYMVYERAYNLMLVRIKSLREFVQQRHAAVTADDLEKLEDTAFHYMQMVYARMLLERRLDPREEHQMETQIKQIRRTLGFTLSDTDRGRLEHALRDLQTVLAEHQSIPNRILALQARLTAMAAAFEEVYHRINADPSHEVSDYLMETLSRFTIEDEISQEIGHLSRAYRAPRQSETP